MLADHASGMEQAVDYLLELGHRRIALITFGDEILPGRERVRGFTTPSRTAAWNRPTDLVRSHKPTADFGFGEASALLQRSDPPTALIAGGNQFLVGVLKAIHQQRIAVPEQVSLVTCDRTDLAALYPVPLTVIDRNIDEMGRTAAQLLLDRIGGDTDKAAHRVRIPTTLILGRSTARPPRQTAVALRAAPRSGRPLPRAKAGKITTKAQRGLSPFTRSIWFPAAPPNLRRFASPIICSDSLSVG